MGGETKDVENVIKYQNIYLNSPYVKARKLVLSEDSCCISE